ncbi:MAG: putative glycosyltransferase [Betaproteobacteria bacterium]|nr:putative glycosyltransferase [Betaproteobacteria bacterium]
MIELLHPNHRFPSGGNVYNRSLVEAAKLRGVPLSSRVVEPSEVAVRLHEESRHFRIWDSLFFDALAAHDFTGTKDWGLLLHYLPSENPTLGRAEHLRLARMEARVVDAAALVIVTGHSLQARLRERHPHRRVFVCEPGVAAPFLSSREKQPRLPHAIVHLLTVANLLPGKALLELLVILAGLRDIDWRWHVIGDRAMDPEYTRGFDAAAKRLRLESRIRQYGALDQAAIAQVMDSMDLFVFPSRFEAYGMALAEAAAQGLPAVTTDVGAAARVYRHGTTALLAAPDDARRFTAHLERLMTDYALRKRFRDNLRLCKPRKWQDTLDDFITATAALA